MVLLSFFGATTFLVAEELEDDMFTTPLPNPLLAFGRVISLRQSVLEYRPLLDIGIIKLEGVSV